MPKSPVRSLKARMIQTRNYFIGVRAKKRKELRKVGVNPRDINTECEEKIIGILNRLLDMTDTRYRKEYEDAKPGWSND